MEDNKACYLELKGGLHDHTNYTQAFHRAPKSDYPQKAKEHGKEVPGNAMSCMMRK